MASVSDFASSSRASSPELGTAQFATKFNKRTGRPIRRSAGKVRPLSVYPGFVDSKIIEDEDEEPIESPSEAEDGHTKPPQRKRKRSPSPEPPPLDAVIRDAEPDEVSEDEPEGLSQNKSTLPPITLQFNIPLGFHGPLMVKLDRSMLQQDMAEVVRSMQVGRASKKIRPAEPEPEPQRSDGQKKPFAFTDLPAELRNKVYRHLFVTDEQLRLPAEKAGQLKRSAQFLSTCKLVHSEGCSILYGENKFYFERNPSTRGPFWEAIPKEIGYKDVRQFLKMIGPENLVYLRDVTLTFEDARPAVTPHLGHEQRRFINDDHLIDVLRVLRQTNLRKISLCFNGRRALTRSDTKFIGYLTQIKADEVVSSRLPGSGWYIHQTKIENRVWKEMQEVMTRKKKLYLTEK